MKGCALEDAGRTEEAIRCYDRALEIAPHVPENWVRKGFCLVNMKQPRAGLVALETGLTYSARSGKLWAAKADVLRELGREEDAEKAWQRALELGYKPEAQA